MLRIRLPAGVHRSGRLCDGGRLGETELLAAWRQLIQVTGATDAAAFPALNKTDSLFVASVHNMRNPSKLRLVLVGKKKSTKSIAYA